MFNSNETYLLFIALIAILGFVLTPVLRVTCRVDFNKWLMHKLKILLIAAPILIILTYFTNPEVLDPGNFVFREVILFIVLIFVMLVIYEFKDSFYRKINEKALVVYTSLLWAVLLSGGPLMQIASIVLMDFSIIWFIGQSLIAPKSFTKQQNTIFSIIACALFIYLFVYLMNPSSPRPDDNLLFLNTAILLLLSVVFIAVLLMDFRPGKKFKAVSYLWFTAVLMLMGFYQVWALVSSLSATDQGLISLVSDSFTSFSLGAIFFSLISSIVASYFSNDFLAEKYSDEQTKPMMLLGLGFLISGSFVANYYLAVFPQQMLVTFWIIAEYVLASVDSNIVLGEK